MDITPSQRAYRCLLRLLLPRAFRERHAADLEAGFAEMLEEARARSGPRGMIAAWLAGTWDLSSQSLRLRWPAARRAPRSGDGRAGNPESFAAGRPDRHAAPGSGPPFAFDAFLRELRVAIRSLMRCPDFSIVAVATLALGIGWNVIVFSVVNGVLVRPLPYPQSARLVQLWGAVEDELTVWGNASLPDLDDWRRAATSFAGMAGYAGERMPLSGADEPALVDVGRVTGDFFEVLGIEAALGRVLGSRDFEEGSASMVVISHRAWRDRFGSDPGVLGRTTRLGDGTYTIIGVLPPMEHALPSAVTDFWVRQEPGMHRGSRSLSAVARLADGVSPAAAQADIDAITSSLAAEYPDSNAARSVRLLPLKEIVIGDSDRLLLVLFAATGFVLAIAVANIVNLFHARALDRRHELAIRTALGASRRRLLAHLGAEALILALAAGGLGVLAAYAAVDAFIALAPPGIPRLDEVTLDATVLWFASFLTFAVALLVSLLPALRAPASLPAPSAAASPRRDRRGWLVATEVALSVVLVVGAGLLIRSFARLQNVDKGFVAEGVLSLRLDLPASRYPGPTEVVGFHEDLLDRIATLPTVTSAGGVTVLPFTRGNLASEVAVDGVERADLTVEFRSLSRDYFETMGMVMLAGRPLGPEDASETPPATVVNEALAQRAWPGEDPVGRTITIFDRTWSVVGVVNDVRHFGLARPPGPEMYVSYRQQPRRYLTYAVRTAGDPTDLVPTVRELVRAADPDLPIEDMATMNERVWQAAAAPRFHAGVLGALAAAALGLAMVGVYGVSSLAVGRRRREIGIRRVLGARTASVMGLVVRRCMFFALVGAAAGAVLAAALSGTLRGLLFEVEPLDLSTFVTAVAIICGAALVGCLLPALRAATVNPVTAIGGDAAKPR